MGAAFQLLFLLMLAIVAIPVYFIGFRGKNKKSADQKELEMLRAKELEELRAKDRARNLNS